MALRDTGLVVSELAWRLAPFQKAKESHFKNPSERNPGECDCDSECNCDCERATVGESALPLPQPAKPPRLGLDWVAVEDDCAKCALGEVVELELRLVDWAKRNLFKGGDPFVSRATADGLNLPVLGITERMIVLQLCDLITSKF